MRFVPWTRRAAWSVGTVPYMNGHAERLVRCIAPLSAGEVVPAVLLAIWVQFDVWLSGPPLAFGHMVGPKPLVAALYAVTSLALVWRRRSPLPVLAFIVAADSALYAV